MRIHTTGDWTLRTTTGIITDLTASEVHGTGAATTTLGTGMPGGGTPGLIPRGGITDGMTRSMPEDGTIHGITEDTGDITTLGTTEAGDAAGTTGTAGTGLTTIITTITDIIPDPATYTTNRGNQSTTRS